MLLEQRPLQGIWGGLWNPPERGAETSVEAFLNHQGVHSSDVKQVQYKESFRHTFSHFHLDIEPIYIELKKVPTMVVRAPNDGYNFRLTESQEAIGLSAAALKLLRG